MGLLAKLFNSMHTSLHDAVQSICIAMNGNPSDLMKSTFSFKLVIWMFVVTTAAILLCCLFRLRHYFRREARLNKRCLHEFTKEEMNSIIVVGSGIVGSSIATLLARDGRNIVLIERDMKEPDRIIGELLQPGGCDVLKKLGLEECLTECDEAQTTLGYVIHDLKTGASVHIPYPKANGTLKEGKAFRHGKFIMSLRAAALNEPRVKVIEGTVQKLLIENDVCVGVKYKLKGEEGDGEDVYAPLVVVADGGFSKFRKQLHDDQVQVYSHFVGCIMKDCPQIQNRHAELVLANPNPILVYKISEEETRVLVDIRGQTLPKNLRDYLIDNILPVMPEHLAGPFEDGVCNERIRYMPCKFLPPSNIRKNGVLMLGDAFNMRHPLTGGGMSVAFNDVAIWRELIHNIEDLTDYRKFDSAYTLFQNKRKLNHSFVVNILAQALYELFSADDEHLSRLRDACFEYFKLGGNCVDGPVGLLSVVSPKPWTLIGHFFAVALYSMWLIMKDAGLAVHIGLYRATGTFIKACHVIFPLIWSELRTMG